MQVVALAVAVEDEPGGRVVAGDLDPQEDVGARYEFLADAAAAALFKERTS